MLADAPAHTLIGYHIRTQHNTTKKRISYFTWHTYHYYDWFVCLVLECVCVGSCSLEPKISEQRWQHKKKAQKRTHTHSHTHAHQTLVEEDDRTVRTSGYTVELRLRTLANERALCLRTDCAPHEQRTRFYIKNDLTHTRAARGSTTQRIILYDAHARDCVVMTRDV